MYVFDDKRSFLHAFLGGLAKLFSKFFPPLSILIVLGFTIYEVREQEPGEYKLGDFIEFIIGYILVDTIL